MCAFLSGSPVMAFDTCPSTEHLSSGLVGCWTVTPTCCAASNRGTAARAKRNVMRGSQNRVYDGCEVGVVTPATCPDSRARSHRRSDEDTRGRHDRSLPSVRLKDLPPDSSTS